VGDSRALENAPVSQILTLAWVLIAYALVGLRSAIRYRPSHASLDLYCLVWLVLFRRPMRRGEDVGIWGFKCPVQAAALRDWSTRCGIDWSILPESKSDAIASDPAFEPGRR